MSEASARGVKLEKEVAKLIRHKLGVQVQRDKRSGAGDGNKADTLDWYNQTRLHIECKAQSTLKVKEWFRQAEGSASAGQTPVVVFEMDNETLCTLRFADLLDFMVEIRQQSDDLAELRKPVEMATVSDPVSAHPLQDDLNELVAEKASAGARTCRNGHLLHDYDSRCLAKGCVYGHYKSKAKKVK